MLRKMHFLERKRFIFPTVLVLLIGVPLLFLAIFFARFLSSSHLSFSEVWQKLNLARKETRLLPADRINFLILGLDQRNDQLEHTLLTDAIIFASFDLKKSKAQMISLPRDLWISPLKTKINALYYYGQQSIVGDGLNYVTGEISLVLGQPLHYTLILDYNDLGYLVDAVGGIDVFLEESFSDKKYPNPAYIEATSSGEPQYKTVTFNAGLNHLNGERTLEFVRSRSSANLEEGTDLARSSRQVDVFRAFLVKLKSRQVLLSPRKLGSLYRFWREKIKTNLTDEDLLAILLKVFPIRKIEISQVGIPITLESTGAILAHPPIKKYGQWVFAPQAGNWSELQKFVQDSLR